MPRSVILFQKSCGFPIILRILVGGLTLGLPVWFAFLDREALPRLKWIEDGAPTPLWGKMVVFVGVFLVVLLALSVPASDFDPTH